MGLEQWRLVFFYRRCGLAMAGRPRICGTGRELRVRSAVELQRQRQKLRYLWAERRVARNRWRVLVRVLVRMLVQSGW